MTWLNLVESMDKPKLSFPKVQGPDRDIAIAQWLIALPLEIWAASVLLIVSNVCPSVISFESGLAVFLAWV